MYMYIYMCMWYLFNHLPSFSQVPAVIAAAWAAGVGDLSSQFPGVMRTSVTSGYED